VRPGPDSYRWHHRRIVRTRAAIHAPRRLRREAWLADQPEPQVDIVPRGRMASGMKIQHGGTDWRLVSPGIGLLLGEEHWVRPEAAKKGLKVVSWRLGNV